MQTQIIGSLSQISSLPILDSNNYQQMAPYRTPSMLLPRSQIAANGNSIHHPLDHHHQQQQISLPIYNNQQYIQNNISLHTNSNSSGIFLTQQQPQTQQSLQPGEGELGYLKQNTLKNISNPATMNNTQIPTASRVNALSGFTNDMQKVSLSQYQEQQHQIPSKAMNGPLMDDSHGSLVYARNVSLTCSALAKDVSSLASSVSGNHIIDHQRRCLSESDAECKMRNNLDSGTYKVPYYTPIAFNNQVHMSPKFFTTSKNIQTNSINNCDNNPQFRQPIMFTINSQHHQQPHHQQQQHHHHQHQTAPQAIPNNNRISATPDPNTALTMNSPTLVPKENHIKPPSPSLSKRIPLGSNGTYIPAQALDRGLFMCIIYILRKKKFNAI